MKFTPTDIEGAYIVDVEPVTDERGFFARTWCPREFEEQGVYESVAQTSIAFSHRKGTLRGLHYQAAPDWEAKLVRCTRGAAYVVAVDLRHDWVSYKRWIGVRLTAANRRMLFVPKGCAQGYQTLADDTEMFYQMSEFYKPGTSRGLRYDDPAFGIPWPLDVEVIAKKDRSWPLFRARSVYPAEA